MFVPQRKKKKIHRKRLKSGEKNSMIQHETIRGREISRRMDEDEKRLKWLLRLLRLACLLLPITKAIFSFCSLFLRPSDLR